MWTRAAMQESSLRKDKRLNKSGERGKRRRAIENNTNERTKRKREVNEREMRGPRSSQQ